MKTLVWEETLVDRGDGSQDHSGWEADNGWGTWYLVEMGFGSDSYVFTATFDGRLIADYDDEGDAKAAAEKHYQDRLTAALEGSVAVPAVLSIDDLNLIFGRPSGYTPTPLTNLFKEFYADMIRHFSPALPRQDRGTPEDGA